MMEQAKQKKEAEEIGPGLFGEKIDLVGGELRTWGQFAASLLSVVTVFSALAPIVRVVLQRL